MAYPTVLEVIMILNSPHQISKHLLENGTSSISSLPHTMLDQMEKLRKQLTWPNESSRKQSSNTRMPTSLYSTGGILQQRALFLASTGTVGTENQDSPINFSKIAETQASKTHQGSCNKEKREASTLLQQRGQTTKRAQTVTYVTLHMKRGLTAIFKKRV